MQAIYHRFDGINNNYCNITLIKVVSRRGRLAVYSPSEQKRNDIYGYPKMKIAEILTKINPTEEMQVRIKTY